MDQESLCKKLLNRCLGEDPLTIYLLQSLREAGCPLRRSQIRCIPTPRSDDSDKTMLPSAGEILDDGSIVVYSDVIAGGWQVGDTLRHELIHAFDRCRVAKTGVEANSVSDHLLSFSSLSPAFRACSEIRAAALSGDCRWTRELLRGNIHWDFGACVRRRAELALQADEAAKGAVARLMGTCLADTAPFFDIPY